VEGVGRGTLRALRAVRRERPVTGGRGQGEGPDPASRVGGHLAGVHADVSGPMTRRRFLTGLGVAATAAVAGGYGVSVWTRGGSATHPSSTPKLKPGNLGVGRTDRTLVVVELGGGNDGLNTVVPFA